MEIWNGTISLMFSNVFVALNICFPATKFPNNTKDWPNFLQQIKTKVIKQHIQSAVRELVWYIETEEKNKRIIFCATAVHMLQAFYTGNISDSVRNMDHLTRTHELEFRL